MKTEILKVKQNIKIDFSKQGQLLRSITDPENIIMNTGEYEDKSFEGILINKSKHYNSIIGEYDDSLKKEDYELVTEPIIIKFTPDPITE